MDTQMPASLRKPAARLLIGVALYALTVGNPVEAALKCNRCQDLLELERSLIVQEAIYRKARELVTSDTRLVDDDALHAALQKAGEDALGGSGQQSGVEVGAVLSTEVGNQRCVIYEGGRESNTKLNVQRFSRGMCKAIADAAIGHERFHQRVCRKKWKEGSQGDLDDMRWKTRHEMEAYWTSIGLLRRSLARLAKKHGWNGSDRRGVEPLPEGSKLAELPGAPTHGALLNLCSMTEPTTPTTTTTLPVTFTATGYCTYEPCSCDSQESGDSPVVHLQGSATVQVGGGVVVATPLELVRDFSCGDWTYVPDPAGLARGNCRRDSGQPAHTSWSAAFAAPGYCGCPDSHAHAAEAIISLVTLIGNNPQYREWFACQ